MLAAGAHGDPSGDDWGWPQQQEKSYTAPNPTGSAKVVWMDRPPGRVISPAKASEVGQRDRRLASDALGCAQPRYTGASWLRGVPGAAAEEVRAGRSGLAGLLLLGMIVLSMLTTASARKLADHSCYTGLTETSTEMDCSSKSLTGKWWLLQFFSVSPSRSIRVRDALGLQSDIHFFSALRYHSDANWAAHGAHMASPV